MLYYEVSMTKGRILSRRVYPGKSQARKLKPFYHKFKKSESDRLISKITKDFKTSRIPKKLSVKTKRHFYGQLLISSRIPRDTDWRTEKCTPGERLSFIAHVAWNDPVNQGFHIPLSEY